MPGPALPSLPIEEWEDTKNTLHPWLQIVGKVRMRLFPRTNHWWHVPLYISARGLTTRPIPYAGSCFEIEFDFCDHALVLRTSGGEARRFPLPGLSVARFYRSLFEQLAALGVDAAIKPVPYDLPFSSVRFPSDTEHAAYDREYVARYWRVLLFVASVFEDFRGRFVGKSTPVHLFWQHMDLVLTRFSGRAAPYQGGKAADREAYSHEVVSFGFWAGDDKVREPAFYSYTYPEPAGLADEPLSPRGRAVEHRWRLGHGVPKLRRRARCAHAARGAAAVPAKRLRGRHPTRWLGPGGPAPELTEPVQDPSKSLPPSTARCCISRSRIFPMTPRFEH